MLEIHPLADGYKYGVVSSRYRWIVLGIAWVALFVTYINRIAWANVVTRASIAFRLPIAALGMFVTAFYIGYVLANAVSGIVTDRLGTRVTLPCSLLSLGGLTYAFSFVHSVAGGMVVQCLMGVATGVDYASVVKIVAEWFRHEHRARAIGAVITAISTGIVAANTTIPVALLDFDWRYMSCLVS
ncbi:MULTISPECIES: MFS transporter [unclassified Caballeronia]|uniref:MFS transporter n=1 Tax=unclassified Caballeronia TaxID=2646786 RepID=UPI00285F9696|nr:MULTISPECIES: MFS transporter [unclassified Caballeronia]MDR5777173.1 MFS transporter [Caballeronia sp. LZ002]MDR5852602.1 MFS transporter [Caballeronia sp. LZ003]